MCRTLASLADDGLFDHDDLGGTIEMDGVITKSTAVTDTDPKR